MNSLQRPGRVILKPNKKENIYWPNPSVFFTKRGGSGTSSCTSWVNWGRRSYLHLCQDIPPIASARTNKLFLPNEVCSWTLEVEPRDCVHATGDISWDKDTIQVLHFLKTAKIQTCDHNHFTNRESLSLLLSFKLFKAAGLSWFSSY